MTTPLLRLPPGWRRAGADGPDVVLHARGPRRAGPAPWLRLRLHDDHDDPVAGGDLEDEDLFVDDLGHDVTYRRWTPREDPTSVCESWSWAAGTRTLTLVAGCTRGAYLDLCDVFEAVAQSIDPDLAVPLPRPA